MNYDVKAFRIEPNPIGTNESGYVVELKNLMYMAEKLSHFGLESKVRLLAPPSRR